MFGEECYRRSLFCKYRTNVFIYCFPCLTSFPLRLFLLPPVLFLWMCLIHLLRYFSRNMEINCSLSFPHLSVIYSVQLCLSIIKPKQWQWILAFEIKFAIENQTWSEKGNIGIEIYCMCWKGCIDWNKYLALKKLPLKN